MSWFRRNPGAAREREPGDISDAEIEAMWQVISVFETGHLPGPEAYSRVALLKDRAGLSGGIVQFTAKSGSLVDVVERYYSKGGALLVAGSELTIAEARRIILASVGMLPTTKTKEVEAMERELQRAGKDPRMQAAQREIRHEKYWAPTLLAGTLLQIRRPLVYLFMLDIAIQMGPPSIDRPLDTGRVARLRPLFAALPPSKGGPERVWGCELNDARGRMLEEGTEPMKASVYRVDALDDLADRGADDPGLWYLETPFELHVRYPSGPRTFTIGADAPPSPRRAT